MIPVNTSILSERINQAPECLYIRVLLYLRLGRREHGSLRSGRDRDVLRLRAVYRHRQSVRIGPDITSKGGLLVKVLAESQALHCSKPCEWE